MHAYRTIRLPAKPGTESRPNAAFVYYPL